MNVLIVDDEVLIAQHIRQLVNEHENCSVVGLAFNGTDALKQMEQKQVDLVLTDIRMPVMDGIALLEQLHERYPQCLVVVLSGYSEFTYAKAALDHHACGYLLKPIIKRNLFPMLDKVSTIWQQQCRTQRCQLIRSALEGTTVSDISSNAVWLLLFRGAEADPQPIFSDTCYSFHHGCDQLLVVEDTVDVPALSALFLEQNSAQQIGNLIGINHPILLHHLHSYAQILHTALEQRIQPFRSQLFWLDPLQIQSVPASIPLQDLHPNRAVDAICTKNQPALHQELLHILQIAAIRQMDIMNYLHMVLGDVRLAYYIPSEQLIPLSQLLLEIVSEARSPEACAHALSRQLLFACNLSSAAQTPSVIVQKIATQLDTNCHLTFSTEILARQYGMTPRALNKAFKEHTGQRVMDYLITKRMFRAKSILEAAPDTRVQDVATSFGYPDAHYFSRLFKRETGLSPQDVKKAAKEKAKLLHSSDP